MFEDQLQRVQELLTTNEDFRKLYDEHQSLQKKLEESGRVMDQFSLERIKKEKLMIKDQLAVYLARYSA